MQLENYRGRVGVCFMLRFIFQNETDYILLLCCPGAEANYFSLSLYFYFTVAIRKHDRRSKSIAPDNRQIDADGLRSLLMSRRDSKMVS